MAHVVLVGYVCTEVRDQYDTIRDYFVLLHLIYGDYNEMRAAENVEYIGKTRQHITF
jgi:hypothetical protein